MARGKRHCCLFPSLTTVYSWKPQRPRNGSRLHVRGRPHTTLVAASVRVPTLAQPVVPAEARQGLPTPVRSEPHQVGCPALPCPVVRDGGAQRQGRQEHCVRKEKESLTGIFNLLSEYRVLKRRCNSQEPKYPFLLKLSMRKGCEHEGVRNPTSNQKH